jgi:hypothetical protein
MTTTPPPQRGFLRDRLFGVLDNLLAQAGLIVIGFVGPLAVAIVLRVPPELTALMLLLMCQIVVVVLLLSLRRGLVAQPLRPDVLVEAAETHTIHLVDRFGLARPVDDPDTVLYLAEILGYQPGDLPEVPQDAVKRVGPRVKSMRDWNPPRTAESAMSFEASRSLKFLRRATRKDDGSTILSFHIRYDSPHRLQISSATLVFLEGSPVPEADISPKHSPITLGLPQCTLLFDGESEARMLSSQHEYLLELTILRDLSPEERDRITTVKLGYIAFTGEFRDTQVRFHKAA